MDSIVYSELNGILNMLGKEYIDALPLEVVETIKNNMDTNYQPVFTMDSLNQNELHPDTVNMIKTFYKKYWNIDDEDTIYIIGEDI